MKNNFFKYYVIITQVISLMLVPPLLVWLICKKTHASQTKFITFLILSILFGVVMAVTFTYKALKVKIIKNKKKVIKKENEQTKNNQDAHERQQEEVNK